METLQAIDARHSIRDYRPDPVPREVLDRLCRAAAAAPSAMNERPWRFYVTTGETRRRVGDIVAQSTVHLEEYVDVMSPEHYAFALKWYSDLGQAPVVIVVTTPDTSDEFWLMNRHLSVGAAIQNLLLAATDQDLATCSITFTHHVKAEIADELQIPEGHSMIAMIALGYPGDASPVAPERDYDIAEFLD